MSRPMTRVFINMYVDNGPKNKTLVFPLLSHWLPTIPPLDAANVLSVLNKCISLVFINVMDQTIALMCRDALSLPVSYSLASLIKSALFCGKEASWLSAKLDWVSLLSSGPVMEASQACQQMLCCRIRVLSVEAQKPFPVAYGGWGKDTDFRNICLGAQTNMEISCSFGENDIPWIKGFFKIQFSY